MTYFQFVKANQLRVNIVNTLAWYTGPAQADAGPMQDLGAGPLWAVILWRHRVQSSVLR